MKFNTKEFNDAYVVVTTCEEYRRNYHFKPDREEFPYPKVGTVLDEEKSVKWNREEVERLRTAYENEVKNRQKEFYDNVNALEERAKELLAKEYGFSKKETDIIWAKANEDGHAYGIVEVYNHFVDLADMYEQLNEAHER